MRGLPVAVIGIGQSGGDDDDLAFFHQPSLTVMSLTTQIGQQIRTADAGTLARALQASRDDTLATFAVFAAALPDLSVPHRSTFNPPLWELGHIGWFQEYWTSRNPHRGLGAKADPAGSRSAGVRGDADALYNSSEVHHASRWQLDLPTVEDTRCDLRQQLARTLDILSRSPSDDDALYFSRLTLLHEDMHHEAALYAAQALDIAISDPRWQAAGHPDPVRQLSFSRSDWTSGRLPERGLAFDNELGEHTTALPAFQIDDRVASWAEFLPFIDAGGYQDPTWWSPVGRAWLIESGQTGPLYLRKQSSGWQQRRYGQWTAMDMTLPASHLTLFEAQAWCRWAGRRMPREAEWERAAIEGIGDFAWGSVWEWTDSCFLPYPGFVAHPYRDFSQPWFATSEQSVDLCLSQQARQVLRGASFMTQPRMRHPHYRNFFPPTRHDVATGFRSCAVC
jgi:ergothioneine biosynthesis protein EgtB